MGSNDTPSASGEVRAGTGCPRIMEIEAAIKDEPQGKLWRPRGG